MGRARLPQPLPHWRVWVDGAEQTYQAQRVFKDLGMLSLGKDVALVFGGTLPNAPTHVVVAQFPKGWVGGWHPSPKP